MAKKKPGRPHSKQPATARVLFAATPEELASIDAAATASGLSRSAFVRHAALESARKMRES